MAKLQIKSETIATFGGIFKIMEIFERLGLGKLVEVVVLYLVSGYIDFVWETENAYIVVDYVKVPFVLIEHAVLFIRI